MTDLRHERTAKTLPEAPHQRPVSGLTDRR